MSEWKIIKGKDKIDQAIEAINGSNKEVDHKIKDDTLDDNKALNFDERGKFIKGNTIGKLPREKIYSTKELVQAIREVEEEGDKFGNKIDILKHYVRQSLIDNRVMIDLIGKKIPKITINEITNTGLPFNLFVTQFVEEKEKDINERPDRPEKPETETLINKGQNGSPPPAE